MLDRDFQAACFLILPAHESGNSGKGLAERGNAAALCAEIYADYGKPLGARGIPMRGFVNEYGKEYSLHVEGYTDTDGNGDESPGFYG